MFPHFEQPKIQYFVLFCRVILFVQLHVPENTVRSQDSLYRTCGAQRGIATFCSRAILGFIFNNE